MTVLVFGQTGQVATELQLQRNVSALGREKADLSNARDCYEAILSAKPQVVINAAAYTAVDKAEAESDLAHKVNADAPLNMAKACSELKIPLVHISTDYVFDGSGETAWVPDDATGPQNVYGASKLAGELAIKSVHDRFAILRTSWVFSAHGSNFLKSMLRLGSERDALSIVSDQIGGPTPAKAIASACLSIADQMIDGAEGGVFHFSGAGDTSWAGFSREIFQSAGLDVDVSDIPTADYPTPASRPLNSRLNCSSLLDQFNIARPDWAAATHDIIKELS